MTAINNLVSLDILFCLLKKKIAFVPKYSFRSLRQHVILKHQQNFLCIFLYDATLSIYFSIYRGKPSLKMTWPMRNFNEDLRKLVKIIINFQSTYVWKSYRGTAAAALNSWKAISRKVQFLRGINGHNWDEKCSVYKGTDSQKINSLIE